ncbi:MAG: class A beta-lactamase-related serine hydrolase [Firmicutes bacterium]|nr:class A beta-lactamase-related serine hydrolase [Bacillota bacterium]
MVYENRQKKASRARKEHRAYITFIVLLFAILIFTAHFLLTNLDEARANVTDALLQLQYARSAAKEALPPLIAPSLITPPTYELDALLIRHGDYLSVFFQNIETGFTYTYNADRVYFSASVPKAVYALYLFQLAEKGIICLDSIHTFTYADANWGSGIIQRRYSFSATFTLRELLRLNISESDNVATLMLRRIYGLDGYKEFIAKMGGNPGLVGCRVMNSNLTANEAGLFAGEIFAYIESGGKYSQEFKEHLLNNQFPFIVSCYPVASKTGWTNPTAWHDMAIVYAPSPYILVILSAREGWADEDYADFAEISMAFQEFNDMWF